MGNLDIRVYVSGHTNETNVEYRIRSDAVEGQASIAASIELNPGQDARLDSIRDVANARARDAIRACIAHLTA